LPAFMSLAFFLKKVGTFDCAIYKSRNGCLNFLQLKTLAVIALAILMIHHPTHAQGEGIDSSKTDLLDKMAPDFAGESLTNKNWDNEKLKGKVVLLNFWFIGCPPCMGEIKYFNRLHDAFADSDFLLLSIAPQVREDLLLFNDTTSESVPATVRNYFKGEPVRYEVIPACGSRLHDDPNKVGVECDHITKDFFVQAYPSTFILDKQGIIRHVQVGFRNTDLGQPSVMEEYTAIIERLLKE